MKKYKVYRLEKPFKSFFSGKDHGNKVYKGAYNARTSFSHYICTMHCGDSHPSKYQDFDAHEIFINSSYYFACTTPYKLNRWFESLLERAYDSNMVISEYTVSSRVLSKSRRQCGFRKSDVISKKVLTLEQFKSLLNEQSFI